MNIKRFYEHSQTFQPITNGVDVDRILIVDSDYDQWVIEDYGDGIEIKLTDISECDSGSYTRSMTMQPSNGGVIIRPAR